MEQKKIRYCRLNRYVAVFLIEKKLVNQEAQIMAKDLDEIGLWSEVTCLNLGVLKLDKTIVDFILRKRTNEPVSTEDFYQNLTNHEQH